MTATTYQGDYSTDWRFWDNTESVTVTTLRAGATTTSIAIGDAFRGDIERKAARLLDVDIVENDQIWTIPASLMGVNELRQADTITDGDVVVWIVLEATLVTLGTSKLYWLATSQKKRT